MPTNIFHVCFECVRLERKQFLMLGFGNHICSVELKSIVMKTLKTLCVLLLMVTGAMAQINPDNMFISGYIVDTNGQAQAGATVCVSYVSNSPVLPSDTVCTNTNSNGYYFIDITNGSLSGPNVYFEVTTYDSCSFLPLSQTVINAQGTIDTAMVDFVICSTGGCNLQVSIVSSYDSLNNSYLGFPFYFRSDNILLI